MKFAYTELAEQDLIGILRDTRRMFGAGQLESYADLIDAAAAMAADDPLRPASMTREEHGPGVRSLHVSYAANRTGAASHLIYYQVRRDSSDAEYLLVLRVLHERMEPARWLAEALRASP